MEMSRTSSLLLLVLLLSSCRSGQQESACLAEDLGQFIFVRQQRLAAGGCRAWYRSPRGRQAVAEVLPGRRRTLGAQGRPVKFERHVVVEQRDGKDTLVGWHHGQLGVKLRLGDVAVAQGPVLRAYLFRYPSDLEADLAALARRAEQLRRQAARRPDAAVLHLAAARKWLTARQTDRALQELYAALDADRLCADCYRELYEIFRQQAQWDLAIRSVRRLSGLRPQDPLPHALLGDIYFEVRNGQQALAAYRRALQLGLAGPEGQRVRRRVGRLEKGLYMIRVLRRPIKRDGGTRQAGGP